MVAIDHDRRRRLLRVLVLVLVLRIAGIRLLDDQHEARAVGGPRILGDAALDVADLHGFTAGPVHQPELSALGALARRDERQVFVVRTPARLRLAVRRRGHLDFLGAVPARHPDVGVVLVGVLDGPRDDVGDPLAVGRPLRIADVLDVVDVADVERALLGERDPWQPHHQRQRQTGGDVLHCECPTTENRRAGDHEPRRKSR